jgi:hypothetical protein
MHPSVVGFIEAPSGQSRRLWFRDEARCPRFPPDGLSARCDLWLLQIRDGFARQQHLQGSGLAGSSGEVAPPFELKNHSMGGWPPHGEEVGYLVLRGRSPVDHRVVVDVGEVLPLSARGRPSHGRNSAQKQRSMPLSFSRIDRNAVPAICPQWMARFRGLAGPG